MRIEARTIGESMNIAILLAAGVGSRFGSKEPKQFFCINNKPVIAYTLDVLDSCEEIDNIQLVVREEYLDRVNKIIALYGYKKIKWIVIGGDSFQQSLMNGIYSLIDSGECFDSDLIQIHIAASPFITNEIIHDSYSICDKYGNAFSAEPIRYPVCYSSDGKRADRIEECDGYFQLEPPWTFKAGELYSLYKKAEKEEKIDTIGGHTTSLYKEYGKDIFLSDYVKNNIKITTKDDVMIFGALLEYNKE